MFLFELLFFSDGAQSVHQSHMKTEVFSHIGQEKISLSVLHLFINF